MRYAKLGALGMFATLLCGGSALAQQTYQQYQVIESHLASPGTADIQNVGFFAGETYDSNVARSDEALAAARGLKRADWITQLGMNATVIQTLGIQRFFIRGDAEFDWYAHNHVLNQAFAHFSGGDTVTMGSCDATLQGDYYRTRTDSLIAIPQVVENVGTTGSVGLNLGCGRKYGLAPRVSVSERWNTNSAYLFRFADSRVFTATAGLDYRNPLLGSLGFFGEFDRTRFDNAIVDVNGNLVRQGFDDWSGGVRYSKEFDPRFKVMATVTYTNVSSNLPNAPNFNGLTYLLDVSYNPTPRLSANADFSRAVLPSSQPFAEYTVTNFYEADIGYAVNDMLRLTLRGYASDSSFRGTTAFFPLVDVNDQKLYRAEGHAEFRFNDHLWFDLFAAEQHGDTNNPGFNYWSTQVGATVRVRFGRD